MGYRVNLDTENNSRIQEMDKAKFESVEEEKRIVLQIINKMRDGEDFHPLEVDWIHYLLGKNKLYYSIMSQYGGKDLNRYLKEHG
mmetsp:Transcript_3079/g.5191  ORF Transcript_3079/g.5191 Transcript_3079/m.5191 type:complete len:85 (-) Transcript_3079:448-702(-)|eukprot:CAMPEP_0168617646 /NCGR_PEP_ID=MMETSP0449_2-20121227/5649_1 /TAXON_ID=1082188 /ORGANISM="Strombidium rassoulzadegani, Strain ras09" /LENGTH=84 /DNA_ID=CAMNT_0008658467 /DNA_START=165 /DNA_END=419 /DNA_ORIENTATION=-